MKDNQPRMRVWLPRQREMIYRDIEITVYHDSVGVGRAGQWYSDIYDAEILLSTGKVDAAQHEIFEGDVVRHLAGRVCVVEWRDTPRILGFDLTAINSVVYAPFRLIWSEWEIIGNIYEHRGFGKRLDEVRRIAEER